MTLQNNLSASLSNYRKANDKSITEFAQDMGISKSELQKLLNDTANPRLDTVEHIAKNLNVKAESLISPNYNSGVFNSALMLLKTLDYFTELPMKDQVRAAEILHELIDIFTTAKGLPVINHTENEEVNGFDDAKTSDNESYSSVDANARLAEEIKR